MQQKTKDPRNQRYLALHTSVISQMGRPVGLSGYPTKDDLDDLKDALLTGSISPVVLSPVLTGLTSQRGNNRVREPALVP